MESKDKNFILGIDNSGDVCGPDEFFNAPVAAALGARFLVYHYRPKLSIAEETERALLFAKRCEEHGLSFVLNTEIGNWAKELKSPDGWDWVSREDGGHRFHFPPEVLQAFASSEAFAGVLYDEAEHAQMFRNLSIAMDNDGFDVPFFPDKEELTVREASEHIIERAKELADENKGAGAPRVMSEYVWPSLMHGFAKAGWDIACKLQKENWSNIWAACAMGAARQYGRELWACVDNWFGVTYPGHSPAEMQSNLLFAYRTGFDRAYVENTGGNGNFYTMKPDGSFTFTEYGERYKEFAGLADGGDRDYSHRDFEPDIAVIRFDDTFWGQGKNMPWKDMLFGIPTLQSTPVSREWLKAFHTITRGAVNEQSLSWGRWDVYIKTPHRSFAPAKGPVVYDETVRYEDLKTASLLFLCGEYISEETLADVRRLVREGVTAVTGVRFAPAETAAGYAGGTLAVDDGNGRWILTDDMASPEVKAEVRPLLGEPDEMTYRFHGKTVRFHISDDGNELVEL